MKIIEQSHTIEKFMPENPIEFIASCARTCYKSEPKASPENDKKLVKSLFEKGHHSQLEHAYASVRLITDRAISHEIVRHRLASFSQESTRYANYSQDRFGSEITVIKPVFWERGSDEFYWWEKCCMYAEDTYMDLLNNGANPQEARSVLPNSTKTEIVVTANLREWIHIFNLRTSKQAHPQIRQLMQSVKEDFQQYIPILFD